MIESPRPQNRLAGTIAVVDRDRARAGRAEEALLRGGHRVQTVEDLDALMSPGVDGSRFDLVLLALDGQNGSEASRVGTVKRWSPSTLVVPVTEEPAASLVIECFRSGAHDVLIEPVSEEKLVGSADRAVSLRNLGNSRKNLAESLERERSRVAELRRLLASDDPFGRILGGSPSIVGLVETLREIARTDSTVLVTGESGTGKGLIARAIHDASGRAKGAFVEASCVVYSEGVLHSELFGHERGAFTGAARQKKGRFELASGGTIFLDEIGEISPNTQLLLLRVLQDRCFERVGGEETLTTDARVVAATNADLETAVRRGAFRRDLFYRLNVIRVQVPALREHLEDVPILASYFARRFAESLGREIEGISPEAMEILSRHSWPGNVRELENLIERLVVLGRSPWIRAEDLPAAMIPRGPARVGLPGTLRESESAQIVEALRRTGGNKKAAAIRLGIHRATLYAKMKRHGISADEGRPENGPDGPETKEPAGAVLAGWAARG